MATEQPNHISYKTIFVDWDGTLSRSRFWERWIGTHHYEHIQEALFQQGRDLLSHWMLGNITYETVLKYLHNKTGIPYQELKDELEFSCKNMSYIDTHIVEAVRALRARGIKVIIATDNMDVFRQWTVPALRLKRTFDGILTSDQRGALKTDFHDAKTNLFFMHYFASNPTILPNETVLIDNSLDTKIVEKTGMSFLHVNESASLIQHLKNILND